MAVTLIRAEVQRAAWLAQAIAVLAEDPVLARTDVDVPALVGRVAGELQAERTLTGLRVIVEATHPCATVHADEPLLAVALGGALLAVQSIAQRAREATIRCAVRPDAKRGALIVEAAQHAVTLPASRLARFFDLGWSDRPGGYAAGIGAVAARRIAELHAGSAEVSAGDEGGCALRLELPIEQP